MLGMKEIGHLQPEISRMRRGAPDPHPRVLSVKGTGDPVEAPWQGPPGGLTARQRTGGVFLTSPARDGRRTYASPARQRGGPGRRRGASPPGRLSRETGSSSSTSPDAEEGIAVVSGNVLRESPSNRRGGNFLPSRIRGTPARPNRGTPRGREPTRTPGGTVRGGRTVSGTAGASSLVGRRKTPRGGGKSRTAGRPDESRPDSWVRGERRSSPGKVGTPLQLTAADERRVEETRRRCGWVERGEGCRTGATAVRKPETRRRPSSKTLPLEREDRGRPRWVLVRCG